MTFPSLPSFSSWLGLHTLYNCLHYSQPFTTVTTTDTPSNHGTYHYHHHHTLYYHTSDPGGAAAAAVDTTALAPAPAPAPAPVRCGNSDGSLLPLHDVGAEAAPACTCHFGSRRSHYRRRQPNEQAAAAGERRRQTLENPGAAAAAIPAVGRSVAEQEDSRCHILRRRRSQSCSYFRSRGQVAGSRRDHVRHPGPGVDQPRS
ncbi:hypothetical protein VTK26DRAFT_9212 [Humicola hyalothermophila]